ncbi:MAG: response regulator [Comamonadaceae bacterium]|nr:MAG: response regulator [Comamonadaceae bacterium]
MSMAGRAASMSHGRHDPAQGLCQENQKCRKARASAPDPGRTLASPAKAVQKGRNPWSGFGLLRHPPTRPWAVHGWPFRALTSKVVAVAVSGSAMSSSNASHSSPPAAAARALRVLLVEDDTAARETAVEMLDLLGHWTAGVSSAEAARDRYLEGAFDVLMCDVGLPGLSGLDLMHSLHAPGVALLLVSGGARPNRLPPGCEWLSKPFGLDDLEAALQRLCPPLPTGPTGPNVQPRVAEGGTGTSSGTVGASGATGTGTTLGTAMGALWPGMAWAAGTTAGVSGT